MTAMDLTTAVLNTPTATACTGRAASGASCGLPSSHTLRLNGCTHYVCVGHAGRFTEVKNSRAAYPGDTITCPTHKTTTTFVAAKVTVKGLTS